MNMNIEFNVQYLQKLIKKTLLKLNAVNNVTFAERTKNSLVLRNFATE